MASLPAVLGQLVVPAGRMFTAQTVVFVGSTSTLAVFAVTFLMTLQISAPGDDFTTSRALVFRAGFG